MHEHLEDGRDDRRRPVRFAERDRVAPQRHAEREEHRRDAHAAEQLEWVEEERWDRDAERAHSDTAERANDDGVLERPQHDLPPPEPGRVRVSGRNDEQRHEDRPH